MVLETLLALVVFGLLALICIIGFRTEERRAREREASRPRAEQPSALRPGP